MSIKFKIHNDFTNLIKIKMKMNIADKKLKEVYWLKNGN